MSREIHMFKWVALAILLAYATTLIPTSLFLTTYSTKAYTNGLVVYEREPRVNNMVVKYTAEVVTEDGRSCTGVFGSAIYEKSDGPVRYTLDERLMPCVEEGSLYRLSTQVLFFRPKTIEVIVEKPNDQENL